jgi:Protein of unknown function (DUF2961)
MDPVWNPAVVDPTLDSRAATFENPTGARGAGGTAHGGRKGSPSRWLEPDERVVLADIDGPGIVRHIWMTFPPSRPETMRALFLEVFYDDRSEPSISVPCLDFFGMPHGRPVPFHSALTAAQEGRGFNSYIPMPFRRRVRVEVVNGAPRRTLLYYQIDYTRQRELPAALGILHASFRRENPTVMRRDFVIAEGLHGPGRFLGCNVGVRVIDAGSWYGEGEVKIYRDGDTDHPTICGTGLEDYAGSAWGLGPHAALYGGAPLDVRAGDATNPDFVGFYRWHVPDPVMFERDLRVTMQQIGAMFFAAGQEEALAGYERTHPVAGEGWIRDAGRGLLAWGIVERVDDFCATAYVYCREVQAVAPLDLEGALADIGRREYEPPTGRAIGATTPA